jgi:ketosteroid isomerase-like protein
MSAHLAAVSAIYEAFGRGDVPAILEHMAEDVRWEAWDDNEAQKAGVPWLQPRRGKSGVLEFFQVVGGFRILDFRVLSLMEGGNQVVAEVVIEAEVPGTGGHYRDEELHLWTFDDQSKVVRMRHYVDTARHIAAAQGRRSG